VSWLTNNALAAHYLIPLRGIDLWEGSLRGHPST
jgi:hypothetical protein